MRRVGFWILPGLLSFAGGASACVGALLTLGGQSGPGISFLALGLGLFSSALFLRSSWPRAGS